MLVVPRHVPFKQGALVRCFSTTVKTFQYQIKESFDNENYWNQIIKSPSTIINKPKLPIPPSKLENIFSRQPVPETGLFKNPYLTSPIGLEKFTNEMLLKAENIVQTLMNDTSDEALRSYVKNLDTLSDLLCKVIDMCEFIRISHPNDNFLQVAQKCHEKMFNYMNLLNTNVTLCENLDLLLNDPSKNHIKSQLNDEEIMVGELLLADFKKSGIDQDEKTRELFIELSSRISIIGQHFNNNAYDIRNQTISLVQKDVMESIPKDIQQQIKSFRFPGKNMKLPLRSEITFALLKFSSNETIRRKIWIELNTSSVKQIQLLELLLNYRKILALKMGYNNYNEYQLEDKMAKSSENVLSFLNQLREKIKKNCIEELRKLIEVKIKDFEDNNDFINLTSYDIKNLEGKLKSLEKFTDEDVLKFICPWDREYLVNKSLVNKRRKNILPENINDQLVTPSISQFFSLGTILSNLSKFLTCIYGVKFKLEKPLVGEIWYNDIRKLLLVNSEDESDVIGIIYMDLFERVGKSMNPAHFTIVCSRKIIDEDEKSHCEILNKSNNSDNIKYIQCVENSNGEIYQLPIITLICNFSKSKNGQAYLSLHEIETLLHEVGHSLHSMFAKTDLHNVSGTRCLTDFVELPSILMETFAKDPRVLKFLSNQDTNNTNDELYKSQLIELYQQENELLKYSDVYSQIKMSYLDQQLYLNTPNPVLYPNNHEIIEITKENNYLITPENLDQLVSSNVGYSKKIYHDCEKDLKLLIDLESTWYGKFGHLFTYGASYYTYLLDRAISTRIYNDLFVENPFDNKNGRVFKDSVLKWGGSKNPWECIGNCLNEEKLKKGDNDSMKFIGEIEEVK